jgi:hypothetical protein
LPFATLITFPGKIPDIFLLSSPTSVGRKISDAGDRGTPGYRGNGRNPSGQKGLISPLYGRFLAL